MKNTIIKCFAFLCCFAIFLGNNVPVGGTTEEDIEISGGPLNDGGEDVGLESLMGIQRVVNVEGDGEFSVNLSAAGEDEESEDEDGREISGVNDMTIRDIIPIRQDGGPEENDGTFTVDKDSVKMYISYYEGDNLEKKQVAGEAEIEETVHNGKPALEISWNAGGLYSEEFSRTSALFSNEEVPFKAEMSFSMQANDGVYSSGGDSPDIETSLDATASWVEPNTRDAREEAFPIANVYVDSAGADEDVKMTKTADEDTGNTGTESVDRKKSKSDEGQTESDDGSGPRSKSGNNRHTSKPDPAEIKRTRAAATEAADAEDNAPSNLRVRVRKAEDNTPPAINERLLTAPPVMNERALATPPPIAIAAETPEPKTINIGTAEVPLSPISDMLAQQNAVLEEKSNPSTGKGSNFCETSLITCVLAGALALCANGLRRRVK